MLFDCLHAIKHTHNGTCCPCEAWKYPMEVHAMSPGNWRETFTEAIPVARWTFCRISWQSEISLSPVTWRGLDFFGFCWCWFQILLGKIPIFTNIFQMGWWNNQPGLCWCFHVFCQEKSENIMVEQANRWETIHVYVACWNLWSVKLYDSRVSDLVDYIICDKNRWIFLSYINNIRVLQSCFWLKYIAIVCRKNLSTISRFVELLSQVNIPINLSGVSWCYTLCNTSYIAQVYHQPKGPKNPHFKRGSTVGFNKGMHADLDQKDLRLAAWGRWFKSQDFCSNRGGNTTAVNFRDYLI